MTESCQIEVITGVKAVPPEEWDRLAGHHDPFVEHAFLLSLEESGCLGGRTGWHPCHVIASDNTGRLRGAVPLYLKTNSYGEYIFDWGWAEAAMDAGISYYPKLVSAVPFTPVTGRRLLTCPDEDAASDAIRSALLAGVHALAERTGASSIHWLFTTAEEQSYLCEHHGYYERLTHQFHWINEGYESFEAYLRSFRNSARKNVRKERSRASQSGLRLETLSGPDLRDAQWEAIYRFYRDTTRRKWGMAYLTREFFEQIRERMPQRVVLALASDGQQPVAGALSFHKGEHLYGRYWGTTIDQECLHFELCYYRPIEFCIERPLKRFEAGAQGQHKLKRGLLPAHTYSAHLLKHPALADAVQRYLKHEKACLDQEMEALAQQSPFRRSGGPIK